MAGEPAKKANSGTSSRIENAELNSRSTRAIKQEISSRANCFIPETKQYLCAVGLEFKVLLILDNATGHPENLKLQIDNVDVAFLFPHISSLIQPLNQALIRTFKAY
ncbi:Tigger transposable element-derived protein 1 [Trichinella nelsoni]|uniref:Tigger transposable element-derived protein 1 n=1 Tax=Trichinella nelsoni TaxID=6336 RepID=A0A0V0SMH5_9BILA|nr:Tigger transposable element-derived protein 1 [Trichinella nelsoni]